jgi:glycosyltransferase involved in cell wall biosynthesis
VAETTSVVIAVYNGERYLGECIESVLTQMVSPDEVIVVDDGSTDRSAAIAASFGRRVTVVRQQNSGQAAALAAGLALASGTCLAFNDADDLWLPQKQEWQVAALTADPDLDAIFGHSEQFVSPELGPDEQHRFAPREATLPGRIFQSALVRRRAFERIGGINPALRGAGCTDWIARMISLGLKNSMLEQVVHRRRLHRDNYGRTNPAERDRNILAVLRDQIERGRGAPSST